MDEIERNARLLKEHCKSPGWDDGSYLRLAQDIAAAGLTLAPIEPIEGPVDEMAAAIFAAQNMITPDEAREMLAESPARRKMYGHTARAAWRAGIGLSR